MRIQSLDINKRVRTVVSVGVVTAFVGVWLWKTYTGRPINPITFAVVVTFAVAAGFGIWGRVFSEAIDKASEVQESASAERAESEENEDDA